ncbi:hypothetical protein BGX20_001079 [Mortierella sp. AD010]|nr:hypothetical protein BGX20_001079 [Mortierella sp. AD010]
MTLSLKQITGDRTIYCMSSFSVSGGYYFVSAIKDIISRCNCQYFMYSHRPCRHMYFSHTVYKDNADPSLRIIHDVLDRTHDRHAVVQIQQNEVEDGYISPNMNDAVLEDEGAELEGWAIELLEILKKGLHDSDSIVRSREMVNGLQEIVEKFYAFPRTISTSDNESRKRQRYFHN